MKKLFLIPALFLCLCVGLPNVAGASGYPMAVIYDNVVVLAKFSDTDFSENQVNTYSQFLEGMISEYEDDAYFFGYNQLQGFNPDSLRSDLQQWMDDGWQIIFVQISKGESPVSASNIWIDIWDDNSDMYMASFGFPTSFLEDPEALNGIFNQ